MQGRYRVLANYHWEETVFPAAFAEQFNRTLDLITVGSEQTRRFLADAGVNVPMAVVGDGVDHLPVAPDEVLPVALPSGFRFLHVSSCFPRKGVDALLAAFGSVFRADDPVSLIIKTFPNPHNSVHEQLQRLRAGDPGFPRVEIVEEDWSPAQIACLYRECQALVAPGRGEGFGLPIAEAMRLGLPVITSRWGGQMDFCDEQGVWLVDGRLRQAETHLSAPGSLWFEPDPASIGRCLRAVYAADPARRETRLQHAARRIAPFTWDRVARRTRQALDRLLEQPGPLPQTRIGWVSTWQARCGIAMYSHYMVAGMQGEAVTVFAPRDADSGIADEPGVERCWERGDAFSAGALLNAVLQAGCEAVVIQCHWAFFPVTALVAVVQALDEAGIHVYLDVHNTRGAPDELASGRDGRAALARCRRVLVHTLNDVAVAQSWGLLDNILLFPLAAYPVPLPEPSRVAARRGELGLTDKRVIASYGFLMPHKGLMELLEAVALLCRTDSNIHYLMVNAHYSEEVSGPEAARLTERIKALGLEDRVTVEARFLPDEESLLLLRTADLVVFPYQHSEESSSAAVRMAIRGGCPVAVTPLTIFDDCASAVLRLPGTAPEGLAEGIADALRRLAEPAFAKGLSDRAAALAEAMSAARLSAQMLGLIQAELRQIEVD
jgi:glycosyltransferase involved in cell wall biosynthesis